MLRPEVTPSPYLIVQKCDRPWETLFAPSRFRLDSDVILELRKVPKLRNEPTLQRSWWVGWGPVELSHLM